ncbi:uncharacterized protein ARMOST_20508 [Armillaria ostoyae]|uniref:Uncharacterized protein n=1 Tax=Armillaria ostoyae TaxID=47428 RepID=A0A284S7J0_ARMOS|nr:uncharacterized protein ARMOST_20508 [Armillaria ostoyae]
MVLMKNSERLQYLVVAAVKSESNLFPNISMSIGARRDHISFMTHKRSKFNILAPSRPIAVQYKTRVPVGISRAANSSRERETIQHLDFANSGPIAQSFRTLTSTAVDKLDRKNYLQSPVCKSFKFSPSVFDIFPVPILPTAFPLSTDMDACPKCAFSAIRPYTPSVNATDLLQRGFSSLDISQASILNDITNLEQELDEIEPLFVQIRDRREKLLKDLRGCKALLAPIRRLPRETLIQIFGLASSDIPDPRDTPWILGEVCSTWRSISRSCPSLWTRIHISTFGRNYSTFLETYISLSVHLPIHMSVEGQLDHKDTDILRCLALHSERWSALELTVTGQALSHLISLASSPAIHLTKLSLFRVGVDQSETNHAAVNCLFSSSPITEVCLRRIPYSSMPINTSHLSKLHVHSYDPGELYSMFQRS